MNDEQIAGVVIVSVMALGLLIYMFSDFYSCAKSHSKLTSITRRCSLGANPLNFEIRSHTVKFSNRFRLRSYTDDYLFFEYVSNNEYWSVSIIKSSAHCFRVIVYCSFMSVHRIAEYCSFRTISDMCSYLDSICL